MYEKEYNALVSYFNFFVKKKSFLQKLVNHCEMRKKCECELKLYCKSEKECVNYIQEMNVAVTEIPLAKLLFFNVSYIQFLN